MPSLAISLLSLLLSRSAAPESSRRSKARSILSRPWRGRIGARARPRLEVLEDRTLLSPYLVTTTADSGPGSLRDAITQVNADTSHTLYPSPGNPGVDEIDFGITAASDTGGGFNSTTGVATITPQLGLPTVANAVLINGYTQGMGTPLAANPNTLAQGDNAVLKVQLNLSGISGSYGAGLRVNADNSTLRGLVFNGVTIDIPAIHVSGTGDHVEGNFIGTDVTGTQVAGNASWGIELAGSNNALVGGTTPGARNLVSGNGNSSLVPYYDTGGIREAGTNDSVQGNYLGTDATGTKALGNGTGIGGGNGGYAIKVEYEVNATIGGTATGAGNLISGNNVGIDVSAGYNSCQIQGNLIGTDVTGTKALGNIAAGINAYGGGGVLIGGTTPAARNIISGNNGGGIVFNDPGNQVEGNYIGTDITGTLAVGNFYGIYNQASGTTTIGGTAPGAGNLISGNGTGIFYPRDDVIQGNLIGTDWTGTKPLGNSTGIYTTSGSNDNTIGGTTAAARNVISGNGYGMQLFGSGNVVEGNFIGTDITGTTTTGLGNYQDVLVVASNNTIGGTAVGSGNIISGSRNDGGVLVLTGATGVAILGNSIHDNPGGGIDVRSGANNNQASPVLTSATSSSSGATITGTLHSVASTTFRIEFFANAAADPSGYGQGRTYLGFTTVTTNASGAGSFTFTLPTPLPAGQTILSATPPTKRPTIPRCSPAMSASPWSARSPPRWPPSR
jgi:titin